jgi:hypothetical protein
VGKIERGACKDHLVLWGGGGGLAFWNLVGGGVEK